MANPQRSILRLVLLGGTLLLYPAAAIVLHGVTPLTTDELTTGGGAAILASWVPQASGSGRMHVTINNTTASRLKIESVTSQVVFGDDTMWSETLEQGFFKPESVTIEPGSTWSWDLSTPYSVPRTGYTWLVTVEAKTEGQPSVQILQTGLDLGNPSHPLSTG